MEKNTKYERRYELDWLRIIAIILLFFFHSAKVFDTETFILIIMSRILG